jgi:hypothetical protein
MKFKICLIISVIALFLLAGCQQKTEDTGLKTFIGGTNGLLMSLEPDFPPAEVFDSSNSPFDVDVRLVNDGEHSVNGSNVEVRLIGLYPPDFGKADADLVKQGSETVYAKTKSSEGQVIDGGISHVIFNGLAYKPVLKGNELNNYRVDLCYNYGTEAVTQICVLKDILRTTESAICKINEEKQVRNSGAPVQVTKVVESRSGASDIGLTIDVANLGTGDVFQKIKKCDESQIKDKNKVWIEVNTGLNVTPECSGLKDESGNAVRTNKGYVSLDPATKTGRINCIQKAQTGQDFVKTINFVLDYDYLQKQDWQLLVKHLG